MILRKVSLRVILIVSFLFIISCRSLPERSPYSPEETLLTIDNTEFTAGEFVYSFMKSHQNEDTISKADVDNYLTLFQNFKLKVAEARKAGYDTVSSYRNELHSYQEQLKSSYRTSDTLIENLKREAYERMQHEVSASHILIRLSDDASPKDTLAAWEKIHSLRRQSSNTSFDELAVRYSEDPSASANKGHLGYFSAFRMVYPFENAAFSTPVGQISRPVRTSFGYHILKVHDKRPAIYKIELEHIQIKPVLEADTTAAGNLAFDLQEMISTGMAPEQAAGSVDKTQFMVRVGNLNENHYRNMPPAIREAVYYLDEPGQVTDPIHFNGIWNLLILKNKSGLPAYEEMKNQLERMVRKADRLEFHKKQLISQFYRKYNLEKQVPEDKIISALDENNEQVVIFTIKEEPVKLQEFQAYLNIKNITLNNDKKVKTAYTEFINNKVNELQDEEAIANNPELRYLLKEYEEGMLLFNIMEDSVWNKATTDTIGFNNFTEELSQTAIGSNKNTLENQTTNSMVKYQEYLEEEWIARLRREHEIKVNPQVLQKVYEKVLD